MTRRTAAFGLGANQGDSEAALRAAVHRLRGSDLLRVTGVSALYRTAPVGGPSQPDFHNAVVVATTDEQPKRLLDLAMQIEQEHGRTRDIRWGPRTLDVDILAVGDLRSTDPTLTLPHPRAHLRAFVLAPWAEVDPDFEVAGHGRVADLLEALPAADRADVHRLAEPGWSEPGALR